MDGRLRGERVVLRAIQRDDLQRLWELFDDLELIARTSNAPPIPESFQSFEAWFVKDARDKQDDRFLLAIEVEGEVIGQCGLHWWDRFRGIAHLGISIGRDYWGRGFGQDACRVLVGYAFRHLNMHKICLEVLADDERAVQAYKKVGFLEEGRLRKQAWFDGEYRDSLMMGLLREEWTD
jgi:ribosomal-protein-alanine N-acetyltransferase